MKKLLVLVALTGGLAMFGLSQNAEASHGYRGRGGCYSGRSYRPSYGHYHRSYPRYRNYNYGYGYGYSSPYYYGGSPYYYGGSGVGVYGRNFGFSFGW